MGENVPARLCWAGAAYLALGRMLARAWEMTKPSILHIPKKVRGDMRLPTHELDEFKAGDSDVTDNSDDDEATVALKRENPDIAQFYDAIPEAHKLAAVIDTKRKKDLRALKTGKVLRASSCRRVGASGAHAVAALTAPCGRFWRGQSTARRPGLTSCGRSATTSTATASTPEGPAAPPPTPRGVRAPAPRDARRRGRLDRAGLRHAG